MLKIRSAICSGVLSAAALIAAASTAFAVELTFWHHTYPPARTFIEKKAAEFTAQHPDITIRLHDDPHGDYEVKLLSAIAAGNAPDIVNVLDYLFPQYGKRGILAEVDLSAFGVKSAAALEALYQPKALSGLTIDGKILGVPEEFNTLALFINKAHFKEIGLDATDPATWPKSWNDLFSLASKLQKPDNSRVGFNWVWNLDPYWYAQQYWPILTQYGCEVVDASGKAAINSDACVKAFSETWKVLIDKKLGGPELATVNPVNALQDFSEGRQSMAIAGIWAPPLYSDAVKAEYVVAPLPQFDPANPKTLLNSYALAVTAGSKHKKEAFQFLSFLTTDSDGYLATTGYVTGRTGWADTKVAKETRGSAIFAEGQKHGSFVWRSPTWSEEGTAIKNAIEQFAQGVPVKQALDQAAADINSIRQR
ncbi:sugar ABC transporter substrate-binding protein [Telmatospirillum sp.]|uniref:ABC transporter substrate-binding protein n=1 Tax=Telmatospirillum sp. TaxID=2079197 RepID=UPI00283D7CDC|nr:sugar ABC transporter substrate-binding protein [Telmatospirillum sp.]MDR3440122.1 sugar ABC transporter substrate-binding protein [Telmatospirillum sp.]